MTRVQLIEIIDDQHKILPESNIIKRFEPFKTLDSTSLITIISGIRRCGKSTLLDEIRLTKRHNDFYLNFDDERLIGFSLNDFQLLTELFTEKYGEQDTYYFDEIQNVNGWERYIRRLHDSGNKVYITGSNARMLSRELGTHLTGRYIQLELYPFSFRDFIQLKKPDFNLNDVNSTSGKAGCMRLFNKYFDEGGIPEYIINNNAVYLRTLYEGVLYRDILTRHNLFKEKEIKELLYFIAGNIAKEVTQNSLAKLTGVRNSSTIKDYLSYFEESYLTFTLLRFDDSIKRQLLAPRKIYFIDNALAKAISFRNSNDHGRMLENIVFLELKRRGGQLFYFKGKKECDFIHINKNRKEVFQVCYQIEDKTLIRETDGLMEAMKVFKLKTGQILTYSEENEMSIKGKKIRIKPVWKWMLE